MWLARRCAPVLVLIVTLVMAAGLVRAAFDDDDDEAGPGPTTVNKNGFEVDERSVGKIAADDTLASGGVILADAFSPVPGQPTFPQLQLRGGNIQVNDPGLDNIQIFTGFRPFIEYTQSETSLAASGR